MGPLLCLLSAAGFGAMAVFGKLAYEAGVEPGDLLLVRFTLAGALLLAIACATGALRGLPRRSVAAGLAMGAIGYATQSGLFFAALERMDASLLALILYVYPTLVMIGAVVLRRERTSRRRIAALLIASTGTALVLAGAASGSIDPLGTALSFGAALAYTVYILTGDRLGNALPPVALAALVCAGASCTFAVAAGVRGGPLLAFGAAGWGWLVAIALVSTVAAILLFFAGLARVGPSAASILSTLEPVVTVTLAAAAFGEALTATQLLGGVLVLCAVVVMQWHVRLERLTGARTAGGVGGSVVVRERGIPEGSTVSSPYCPQWRYAETERTPIASTRTRGTDGEAAVGTGRRRGGSARRRRRLPGRGAHPGGPRLPDDVARRAIHHRPRPDPGRGCGQP